ncbi:hypothetical protein QMY03_09845 [Arthrobacter sp. KFRI-F3372]|nr:hypothetical protein QMY03_09845 [Arthrobacter sp. KFRI-F3372]
MFLGGVGLILTAVFTTLGLILIVAGLRGRRRDKVRSSNVGSGASQSGRTNVEVLTHTANWFARPAPFVSDVADTQQRVQAFLCPADSLLMKPLRSASVPGAAEKARRYSLPPVKD